jgi:peptidoglycan/LPS O-acetylase OafA/YrhL
VGATGTRSTLRYMPALDGMRAFAVAAVLLYHGQVAWAEGGFLGVDAFFVLSGFLITSLLVTEWTDTGTIALSAFWARRARRLLPALFLVLLGVALYAVLMAGSDELDNVRQDGLATLGYVANWRFIFSGQSYFDQFSLPSPLRHTWSLAIEEQFYLIWPLIVLGVMRWRRTLGALAIVTAGLLTASVVTMIVLYHPGSDPSRVYYGTDTRAQSLLVGALVALAFAAFGPAKSERTKRGLQIAGAMGAAFTLWMWTQTYEGSASLYDGGGLLITAIAVAAVIASVAQPDESGPLASFLSLPALIWVGRISYGLYLWHWPVYLVMTESRTGLSDPFLLIARLAVTVGLSTASYYLVEQPIRHGAFPGWRAWAVAPVTAALVLGAVFVTTSGGEPVTYAAAASASKEPPPPPSLRISGEASAPTDRPMRVLVVGDSVAWSLGLGLQEAQSAWNIQVWNVAELGCGISRGGSVVIGGHLESQSSTCDDWPEEWPAMVDQFRPDAVVMLIGAWDVLDRQIDGQWFRLGTPEHEDYFVNELVLAVDALASRGAHVALLTSPYFDVNGSLRDLSRDWSEFEPWRVDALNGLLREYLDRYPGDAQVYDLNALVSPGGVYAQYVNDIEVRDDGVHFSKEGAIFVGEWLVPLLSDRPNPWAVFSVLT